MGLRSLPLICLPDNPREQMEGCLSDTYRERTSLLEHSTESIGGVLFVQRAAIHISPSRKGGAPKATDDDPFPVACAGIGKANWLQSLGTTPEWLAWNQAMAKLANDMEEDTLAGGCEEVWIAVKTVTPYFVSATMGNMVYSGGAHPNHSSISLNWLLKDDRELKLEICSRPGSGWEAWMQKDIDLYLHQKLDDENGSYETKFRAMAKTLQSIVADPRHWSVGRDGLSVFFNPYEVACYACTPDPLTIPWAELKPYLNPAFEIPQ